MRCAPPGSPIAEDAAKLISDDQDAEKAAAL
jgi:hypothetical protein